ncbi:outer membrane protein assembly factor BamB family protein [Mariniblastus fucicola]|uniref:Serine/threonine-protein kinase AfsK n=1 Tax=Mariniblastus fucicola TaxID=980251 RepID=A0A5B9P649_9BACT|nr:PQQ-binding-like beta-propeller repeat protein [Mariniblastus fucicola]QEG20472.1 Serine/threonine-protein kinase AfsK [Mariniblastus fucicola]
MFQRLSFSLAILALCATPLFAQQAKVDEAAKAAAWPMARGNETSTGAIEKSIGDKFEIDWEFKYPKGAFESSPIIASHEGKPTIFTSGIDVNVKGKLFSIDLETGKSNWDFEIEEGFVSSPAWRDGRIFVGDMIGMIYCVDAANGKALWTYETQGEISSGGNFFKSLVLFGSQDAKLYALERETGELKWAHSVDDQIQCGATVAGNRCFLAGCDSKLHVIGLDDGKEVSTVEIGSPTGTTAAAVGDDVYFGTEQGTFFSINFQTPEVNWRWEEPAGATSVRSSASVTNDHLVFGARNRKINCLDPKTGTLKWSTTVKAKVDGSPIIAGDRVYVGSTDGRFYTLNLEDGKVIWQTQFNGAILGSPAIIGGKLPRLVVATERGTVYCLKPAE